MLSNERCTTRVEKHTSSQLILLAFLRRHEMVKKIVFYSCVSAVALTTCLVSSVPDSINKISVSIFHLCYEIVITRHHGIRFENTRGEPRLMQHMRDIPTTLN